MPGVTRRHVGELCADGGLRVASLDGEDVAALVAWYERRGFRRAGTFTLGDGWVGQVFQIEL